MIFIKTYTQRYLRNIQASYTLHTNLICPTPLILKMSHSIYCLVWGEFGVTPRFMLIRANVGYRVQDLEFGV